MYTINLSDAVTLDGAYVRVRASPVGRRVTRFVAVGGKLVATAAA